MSELKEAFAAIDDLSDGSKHDWRKIAHTLAKHYRRADDAGRLLDERTKERDAYQKLWHRDAKAAKAARADALLEVIHLMAPDGEAASEHEREILETITGWRTASLPAAPSAEPSIRTHKDPCYCAGDYCGSPSTHYASPAPAKEGEKR